MLALDILHCFLEEDATPTEIVSSPGRDEELSLLSGETDLASADELNHGAIFR